MPDFESTAIVRSASSESIVDDENPVSATALEPKTTTATRSDGALLATNLRANLDDAFVRRLAIAGGRDVVAAGEQKALGPVERIGDAHRLIDDPDVAAGVQHRLTIVLEFATICDSDYRHKIDDRPPYIRAGTSMPINSSVRVS